ncbi:hypothetical protein ABAC460_21765 [Asticcacaulis sp. AC460]|uniref:hypothetical protein n=1 Tax=Asticcacaulis sp. AC460 TaxID=1282360 RepID=UPI0003C3C91A|nr:hypothetical protein [Asticcacaulis sp. AC460]ESQ86847.1 hypothetical protein ABAC460_21765 [Asticcacaulis sp. AC460]
MKAFILAAISSLTLVAGPLYAQDDGYSEVVVVSGVRRSSLSGSATAVVAPPPVIGLKRQADSAVRNIEIVSDSREEAMRRQEVQTMLFDAIDRAKRNGFTLVTGQFELVEVTKANWKDLFPGLAGTEDSQDDEDDDSYDDDDDNQPPPAFEDSGSIMVVRLKVKTKLDGSIGNAQQAIDKFVKSVPATGRSQIEQTGGLALTIINPEQYRDEIYRRIAAGATHAMSFYGAEYGLDVTGLDKSIAWKQVSNTEVFLYIPYGFSIKK